MSVLLLRLAGPMQSWGVQSQFSVRDTGLEPSKSGVIGLLCAALGRPRHEPVADLAALKMAVRVDREGRVARDFQTAQDFIEAGGRPAKNAETVLSQRYYLADASFLVGLEGDAGFLRRLDAGLAAPVWPLSLGRKSFVPSDPVRVGPPTEASLRDTLVAHPRETRRGEVAEPTVRFVWEVSYAKGELRRDVPVSFAERRFDVRHVMMRSAKFGDWPHAWTEA
jgi:CRISPR system Cascade subunit CasD